MAIGAHVTSGDEFKRVCEGRRIIRRTLRRDQPLSVTVEDDSVHLEFESEQGFSSLPDVLNAEYDYFDTVEVDASTDTETLSCRYLFDVFQLVAVQRAWTEWRDFVRARNQIDADLSTAESPALSMTFDEELFREWGTVKGLHEAVHSTAQFGQGTPRVTQLVDSTGVALSLELQGIHAHEARNVYRQLASRLSVRVMSSGSFEWEEDHGLIEFEVPLFVFQSDAVEEALEAHLDALATKNRIVLS